MRRLRACPAAGFSCLLVSGMRSTPPPRAGPRPPGPPIRVLLAVVGVLAGAAILMLVGIYPLLSMLAASHTTLTLIGVQTAFCMMVALFVGVAPATLAGIFPTAVRSSGMSLSYNFAVTVFGGFAPAILTWLTLRAGGGFAPAWYVMAACCVTLVSIIFLPADPAQLDLRPETA